MKRVLVTGATGFIGRQCLPILRQLGYEVCAVSRHAESRQFDCDIRWYTADLLVGERIESLIRAVAPTHLLHLAWYAVPEKFWTAEENVAWRRASEALGRAFVKGGGRRIVAVGTCAEYDWSEGVCSETSTPIRPNSLYAQSKQALHVALAAATAEAKIDLAWARVFWLYGPNEHPARLVPSIVLPLLRGERAVCHQRSAARDFLHVRDVASALCALLDSTVSGPVNIGSGVATPVGEVVERIASMLDAEERITYEAGNGLDAPVVVADPRRLVSEVGWKPSFDLGSGLADAVSWWRSVSVAGGLYGHE